MELMFLRNQIKVRFLAMVQLACMLSFFVALTVQAQDSINEIAVKISDINIQKNTLMLFEAGHEVTEYRMVKGIDIRLANGDKGLAGNLKLKDAAVVIVNVNKRLIHKLYVLREYR